MPTIPGRTAAWISVACGALIATGIVAVVVVDFTVPGGHPPLSAYAALAVAFAALVIAPMGLVCGVVGWRRGQRLLAGIGMAANALWLILAIVAFTA